MIDSFCPNFWWVTITNLINWNNQFVLPTYFLGIDQKKIDLEYGRRLSACPHLDKLGRKKTLHVHLPRPLTALCFIIYYLFAQAFSGPLNRPLARMRTFSPFLCPLFCPAGPPGMPPPRSPNVLPRRVVHTLILRHFLFNEVPGFLVPNCWKDVAKLFRYAAM